MSEPRDPRLPHDVVEVSPLWIPMPDGTRLAGRAWLPAWASAGRPVPALFELIPYRTRDLTAIRDEALHGTFAANGYASIRVDIRGSGDSEGLIPGEYLAQELQDGADCIAWIAAQPWCTGAVGMFGNSWGGFNALQVAALRPPALRAIVTSCSTDDRFADDMHWMGGALLTDMLDWGCTFLCWMALPPDPAVTGETWRERWAERIALAVDAPAVVDWLAHQERDAFWRHGSVNEGYDAIEVPVLAVGGWQDGYSNAIPRLLDGLSVPRMGVIGPWAHGYPHAAPPGPNIDLFALAVRWWDRWLKDAPNGIDEEPAFQAFIPDGLPPEPWYAEARGRWVAETTWPSPRIRTRRWTLGADGALRDVEDVGASASIDVRTDQTVGIAAGEWCPFGTGGRGPELPGDQAPDDARSVCFDTAELDERITILGAPVLRLAVPTGETPGLLVVRLCDVWPDGRSTRVSYAVRHAGAPGDPGPADGVLELRLNDVGYAFLSGHRIRVALSTTSWPMVWPEASPSTLRFTAGPASGLELPIRPTTGGPAPSPLGEGWRPAARAQELAPARYERVEHRDGDRLELRNTIDGGRWRIAATGVTESTGAEDVASICEGDPLSARMTSVRTVTLEHPDGTCVTVTGRLELTATADAWLLSGAMLALDGDRVVADRVFERRIPRRVP